MIHQLSKQATQNPFRKNRGRVSRVLFHPSKPFLLVATEHHVRVYNLVKQALARKLVGSSGGFTCLAIHSSGDHVLAGDPPFPVSLVPGRLHVLQALRHVLSMVLSTKCARPPCWAALTGSEDRRLAWYDLDLSTKPYKALRYHKAAVRGAAYHRGYPLFASSSDDGAVHVFHGMVYQVLGVATQQYASLSDDLCDMPALISSTSRHWCWVPSLRQCCVQDLMTNPLIVPVKILRGHTVVASEGVLDVAFHPTQPWLFTAGADATINLFTNS